ncbi:hypothetical protein DFH11DRAFT_873748 [Phellopilus nigrolimitatus]|nr:hypothetical protein DFH11DRAFT_873748 [Phellopilus nigrolimitatus]
MFRTTSTTASRTLTALKQTINRRPFSRWTPQVPQQSAATRNPKRTNYMQHAQFHTTPPRQHQLVAALLAGLLKASGSIEFARMTTRIALTFVPFVMVKNHLTRKYMRHIIKDTPEMKDRRIVLQKKLRQRTIFYRALIAVPIVIVGLTFIASLERTPLSGRWRVILLSPEEEDAISDQLKGSGWYRAVHDIISQDGAPDIIPPSDWRYQWVQDVLRYLESVIPILAHEKGADLPWLECGPDDIPLPPPAKYPLKPRPSAKEYLRWFCDSTTGTSQVPPEAPHLIPGPPYNLVLVDYPECDNAFSFGFGPDGGGGIVVYSGFLDRILEKSLKTPADCPSSEPPSPVVSSLPSTSNSRSLLSALLGSLLPSAFAASSSTPNASRAPPASTPTPEQTTQLAILLAHELAHLVLSHHLETLSAGTVVIPGTMSMVADLIRAVVFPFTMIFGPFVNDAVASLGTYGSGEFAKLTESCTSMVQEFEADAVSARILAHAGFDARKTVDFWERRRAASVSECSPQRAAENADFEYDPAAAVPGAVPTRSLSSRLARRIVGVTHPVHEARVLRLKSELQRWQTERAKVLRRLRKQARPKHWGWMRFDG